MVEHVTGVADLCDCVLRHLLEALYYGLKKSAPTLAIDSS